jgi:hypothetical protein
MSKPKLYNCKSHDDIVRAAMGQGCEIRNGGCHTKIYRDGHYITAVPRHKGDLAKGTLCAILKALAGLMVLFTFLILIGTLQ